MRTITTTLLALAIAGSASAADTGGTSAGAETQTFDQQSQQYLQKLPEMARDCIAREARQHEARITDVDKKDKDGLTYYKVDLKNEAGTTTVKVLQDGHIVEIDPVREKFEDLPKGARDALLNDAKDGEKISRVEKTSRNGQTAYMAVLSQDGRSRDVVVDAGGKSLPLMEGGSSSGSETMERTRDAMDRAGRKTGDALDRAGDKAHEAGERANQGR